MNQELSTAKYFASASNDVDPSAEVTPRRRPAWPIYLTIVCVLFLLTGLVGAIGSAWGISGLFAEPETSTVAHSSATREMQKLARVQAEATEKYFPVLLGVRFMQLALAAAFMFAAVYLFSRNKNARTLAIGVCGVALFYNVCSLGSSLLMLQETGAAVSSMMDDAFSQMRFEDSDQEAKVRQFAENSMLNSVTIALAIAFLVKLVYYGAIMAYLWTDDVKKVFGEDPLDYLKEEMQESDAEALQPTVT